MKNNEEIFDLFRRNEHKLDAPPSPMAWDRLERKLDNKKSAKRKVIWNYYAAAAGILLLVVAGLFYLNLDSNTHNSFPTAAQESTVAKEPIALEEAKPARPILMSHREKQQYYGNQPIADNTLNNNRNVNKSPVDKASKKLEVQHTEQADDELIAQNLDQIGNNSLGKSTTPKPVQPAKPKISNTPVSTYRPGNAPSPPSTISGNSGGEALFDNIQLDDASQEVAEEIEEQVVTTTTTTGSTMPEVNSPIKQRESANPYGKAKESELAKSSAEKETKRKKRKAEPYSSTMPEIASSESIEEKDIADYKADKAISNQSITAQPSASAPEPLSTSKNYQISQLKWIAGNWVNNDNNTLEVWENVSSSQLIGKVFEQSGTDAAYESDLIQIKKTRGKIILILHNEVYDLIDIDGKKATFKSQENNKRAVKITQSGNRLKIVKQQPNNTETKILKKE